MYYFGPSPNALGAFAVCPASIGAIASRAQTGVLYRQTLLNLGMKRRLAMPIGRRFENEIVSLVTNFGVFGNSPLPELSKLATLFGSVRLRVVR